MSQAILRVTRNPSPTGRDWIVADVHGQFSKLERELQEAGFSPKLGDRLFMLGDLVDRGPESHLVLEWLDKPWVYAILGNHEDLAIMYSEGVLTSSNYRANGGLWFLESPQPRQFAIASRFSQLPLAIELETASERIGLVHANVPYADWDAFATYARTQGPESHHCYHAALWDRSRIENKEDSVVKGIDNVVVGHNRVKKPLLLGNVLHLDTGGWLPTVPFSFLDAATFQLV